MCENWPYKRAFDLTRGKFFTKMWIPFGTCQKLTIQAGWPYIRGPYKWARLYSKLKSLRTLLNPNNANLGKGATGTRNFPNSVYLLFPVYSACNIDSLSEVKTLRRLRRLLLSPTLMSNSLPRSTGIVESSVAAKAITIISFCKFPSLSSKLARSKRFIFSQMIHYVATSGASAKISSANHLLTLLILPSNPDSPEGYHR